MEPFFIFFPFKRSYKQPRIARKRSQTCLSNPFKSLEKGQKASRWLGDRLVRGLTTRLGLFMRPHHRRAHVNHFVFSEYYNIHIQYMPTRRLPYWQKCRFPRLACACFVDIFRHDWDMHELWTSCGMTGACLLLWGGGVNGKKTVLLTDGAPCYVTLAKDLRIQHEAVNRPAKQGREHIQCHTGTIDSVWALLKRFIPKTLSSHNDKLWLYRL